MRVNDNVAVYDFVHKCESVCLAAYVEQFHIYYVLFDMCCDTIRSS